MKVMALLALTAVVLGYCCTSGAATDWTMWWIDNAEGTTNDGPPGNAPKDLDSDEGTGSDYGFAWTNATRTAGSATVPTADATGNALAITAAASGVTIADYTDVTTNYAATDLSGFDGLDWGNDGSLRAPGTDENISAWYVGFYLYTNDVAITTNLLQIKVIEEDYDAGGSQRVADVFKLTNEIEMTWTGWRYVMKQLPAIGGGLNAFSDTLESHGSADKLWNPDVVDNTVTAGQEHAGFYSFVLEFTNNNVGAAATIYIDEVTIGQVAGTTGWVKMIYPTADVEDYAVDKTLGRLPPTVSAVFDIIADGGNSDLTVCDMVVIDESAPTDNLMGGAAEDDGDLGLFATPNDTADPGSYASDRTIVIFVRPADAQGDFGMAEVVTFTVEALGDDAKTYYHSVRTD